MSYDNKLKQKEIKKGGSKVKKREKCSRWLEECKYILHILSGFTRNK